MSSYKTINKIDCFSFINHYYTEEDCRAFSEKKIVIALLPFMIDY